MKLSSTILQHHILFLAHLAIFAELCLSTFARKFTFTYALVANVSLSADFSDAKRLQTQTAPQKGPKTSFEKRTSCLYVFDIFLPVETSLWHQRKSCNVLSHATFLVTSLASLMSKTFTKLFNSLLNILI